MFYVLALWAKLLEATYDLYNGSRIFLSLDVVDFIQSLEEREDMGLTYRGRLGFRLSVTASTF
jgi:hypothetical protein